MTGLPHAKSHLLTRNAGVAVRHGFYGLKGGVSSGDYATLNAGPGSDDDPSAVVENRRRIAADLGLGDPSYLQSLYQVHGREAVRLTTPMADRPKADAAVTAEPGLALCILTADCVPILLADPEAGVIGAAHAGWRGALAGIAGACIEAMEALGASRDRITAAVGPCIHQASYEVGPEFEGAFRGASPDHGRFFQPGAGDRRHFDLPGFVDFQLRSQCGIGQVDVIPHDTCAMDQDYFSNRRRTKAGLADYGRNASVIVIEP